MKKLYSVLIALGVLALLASVAGAAAAKPFPSWSNQINTPKRFTVLTAFGGAAVLDTETGLVWERSPSTSAFTWLGVQSHCNTKTVGGRKGWRLPTLQELTSLVEPSVASPGPTLPSGHPFTNVQNSVYWSVTTNASDTNFAWIVNFFDGDVDFFVKSIEEFAWCVRGGQGVDPQ